MTSSDAHSHDLDEAPVVDLLQFCGSRGARHAFVWAPWSAGEWTYATNGHLAVRVPRRADVAELSDNPAARLDEWLAAVRDVELVPLPELSKPPPKQTRCIHCSGSGVAHQCPDCTCDCDTCGGTGLVTAEWTVTWCGVHLDGHHWLQIAALPEARIATAVAGAGHVAFAFAGDGRGILMPMLHPHRVAFVLNHVRT